MNELNNFEQDKAIAKAVADTNRYRYMKDKDSTLRFSLDSALIGSIAVGECFEALNEPDKSLKYTMLGTSVLLAYVSYQKVRSAIFEHQLTRSLARETEFIKNNSHVEGDIDGMGTI